jgi:peptide/nickel transport system permease protein
MPEGTTEYLLGSDPLGRDILSRIVYGSRISLIVGVAAVAIQGSIGVLLGLVAGYYGGLADRLIMRLADLQLSIPFLVLALALIAALGSGLKNVIIVLGLTGWMGYGRVVRAEVLALKHQEFVDAARAIGMRSQRIVFRHILPNTMDSAVVMATLQAAKMMTSEAVLSFLGLGVQPPTPSWGGMVADGRSYVASHWWIALFPGLAIFVTVLSLNLVGDWLRDSFDPTLDG